MNIWTGPVVRDPRQRYIVRYFPSGESMTELSHAQSCDINYIVNRYQATGFFPQAKKPPIYADVTPAQKPLNELIDFVHKAKTRYQVIIDELERRKAEAAAAPEVKPAVAGE